MTQIFITLRLLNTGMVIMEKICTQDLTANKSSTLSCHHTIRVDMDQ